MMSEAGFVYLWQILENWCFSVLSWRGIDPGSNPYLLSRYLIFKGTALRAYRTHVVCAIARMALFVVNFCEFMVLWSRNIVLFHGITEFQEANTH